MAKTHKQFVEELKEISPTIEVIGHYEKAANRIAVRCMVCGKKWTPVAYSLLSGKGCPHCSAVKGAMSNRGKTGTKELDIFKAELRELSSSVEVIGDYINNKTPIECHCLRCGTTWKARPDALLHGHGCPRCAKSGTSFMEQFILLSFRHVLGNDGVLSRNRSAIGMELDVYIPDRHLAIEPGNWYLHKRSLARDELKRSKCAVQDIRLITIYDNYPKGLAPPFDKDCFTFDDDYNNSDYINIRQLVYKLFEIGKIDYCFSEEEYAHITEMAYNNSLSRTHEQFVTELNSISPSIQVIGQYVNANKRLKVKCTKCGFEWDAIPASLLCGDGCRKCGIKIAHKAFLKPQEEFVSQLHAINPDIMIIGQYKGRHAPVKAKCLICGYEWSPIASSLLRGSTHKSAKSMHKRLDDIRG